MIFRITFPVVAVEELDIDTYKPVEVKNPQVGIRVWATSAHEALAKAEEVLAELIEAECDGRIIKHRS